MSFIEEIAAKAEEVRAKLTGDARQVTDLVAAHDLVVCVWNEPTAKNGIETMVIKGEGLLTKVVLTSTAQELRWTAIPCVSAEQAEELRNVSGERRRPRLISSR